MTSLFANPWALSLVWLFPLLCLLAGVARYRQERKLARLASALALRSLAPVRRSRRWLRTCCFSAGLFVLVVAIVGPQWGYEPDPALASGRDLVVVLDLSRSMLAEDVLPNRVGRAKNALLELADAVQQRGGHRIALVAFAGQARIVCPLTPDYDHFRTALAALEVGDPKLTPTATAAGPASGTRIGLALKQAVELHDSRFRGHQDIVLVSDGDDPAHDNEWRAGASEAMIRGIPIYTVGIGNPASDSPIPAKDDRPLLHDGKEVRTRLDEAPLDELAQMTGGSYVPARLDLPPMTELFRQRMMTRPTRELGEDVVPTLAPRYPWFFAVALTLFVLSLLIHERPRRRTVPAPRTLRDVRRASPTRSRAPVLTSLLVAMTLASVSAAPPREALELVRAGNAAFAAENYALAVDYYTHAEETITDPGLVAFNKAAALYHLGRYREAELHYLRCRADADAARRTSVLFNLGNAVVQQSHGTDVKLLERAIGFYQQCLGAQDLSPELLANATFNLTLAQTLRQNAKPGAADSGSKPAHQQGDGLNDKGKPRTASTSTDGNVADQQPGAEKGLASGENGKEAKRRAGQRTQAAASTLPPVPDEDRLVPMSPADTLAHLQRVAERIENERKAQQRRSVMPPRNALDW